MPLVKYKLLAPSGEIESHHVLLPFDDVSAAIRYLEKQGGVVVGIRIYPPFITRLYVLYSQFFSSITRQELAEFFNNLSMMQGAGVPILTALKEIGTDVRNSALKNIIKLLGTDIEMGQTFSEALSRHPRIFSKLILNMMKVGEETGRLDEMEKKASQYLLNIDKIIKDTKRALRYPAFLMLVVTGAVTFWFAFVVPQIVGLFYEMKVSLPLPTRILIATSGLFKRWGMLVFISIITFVIFVLLLRRVSRRVKYVTDLFLLHVPILKGIITTSYVARISENLGILVSSGISILRTFDIIIDSVANEVYKRKLQQAKELIQMGNTVAASLRTTQALHPFAVRMIAVGEDTGKLDEQSQYIANVYRERLENLVETLSKTLEPLLLMFLGAIFALILAGLLLPIYDLVSKMGAM